MPLYLAEVSPQEIRGMMISFNVAMITIGQLLSCIFVYYIRPNWRLMLGLAAVPSVLQFIGMISMPESPRWLGKMGEMKASRRVMAQIYKQEYIFDANEELEMEIENLKIETQMTESQRMRSLFSTYGRCLMIGCGLQAF